MKNKNADFMYKLFSRKRNLTLKEFRLALALLWNRSFTRSKTGRHNKRLAKFIETFGASLSNMYEEKKQ